MSTLILELIGLLLYVNNNVTYFDSFGVEHIPKEIKAFINRPLYSGSQNKSKNKCFQSISILFNNVRIFLYWIY